MKHGFRIAYDSADWQARLHNPDGRFAAFPAEMFEKLSTFDGYIWARFFGDNFLKMWSLFAFIYGALLMSFVVEGGPLGRPSAAKEYTLSLPITRKRLIITDKPPSNNPLSLQAR